MTKHIMLTALLVTLSLTSMAKSVVLGSSEYPPYFSEFMPEQGFLTQITKEAFEKVGYKVEVRFKPFARTYEDGKLGDNDGIIVLWHTKERETWFAFSDALPANQIGFYRLNETDVAFKEYSDLKNYRIGIVRSYANPPGFDKANLNTYVVPEDNRLMLMLKYKRIDLALMDRGVGSYFLQHQYPELQNKVSFIEPPLEIKPQYIAFSKKSDGYQQRLEDFNRGLRLLKQEGRVAEILTRHGFTNLIN